MSLKAITHQKKATGILLNAIKNERVAHAFLFAGAMGVGKLEAAKAFAMAINCKAPDTQGDACGECNACRKIAKSMDTEHVVHPDIIHLLPGEFIKDGKKQKSRTIVVGAIRDLRQRLFNAPLEAKMRVVFVHDADQMKIEAQNAFLKTLEEPTEKIRTLFILLTARPLYLLPTIRSRCQMIRFGHIDEATLLAHIGEVAADLPRAQQIIAARLSGGSLTAALRYAESFQADEESQSEHTLWLDAYERALQGDSQTLLKLVGSKDACQELLDFLIVWHRDILLYLQTGETGAIVHVDKIERIEAAAQRLTPERIFTRIERFLEIRRTLENNIRPALAIDAAIMAFRHL